MRLILLAVPILLSACATWEQPGKTAGDFERDRYECQRDAAPVQDTFRAGQMIGQCLRLKGYRSR